MLSLLQGKQNLWWLTDGHWTKCVSSSLSWQIVHFSVGFGAGAAGAGATDVGIPPSDTVGPPTLATPPFALAWASVDVTVVLETCLEPDDLLPLEEPALNFLKQTKKFKFVWIFI